MLYDRDYMRESGGGGWRSPLNLLLIVLVGIFLIECVLRVYGGASLTLIFGLSGQALGRFEVWRLVTYQFLHDAPWPWHILFNGIALWFFGRAMLETVGVRRFWKIYLSAGVFGGLLEVGCQAWYPNYGQGYTVGASGSVLGLIGAYCFLFPGREVMFFLYVFPVRLKSMTLFWILFGFSVFGVAFLHSGIAHGAHLGGLLTGVAYVRLFLHEDGRAWLRRLNPFGGLGRRPGRMSVPAGQGLGGLNPGAGGGRGPVETPEDFMRREVDPILDKISAHGIQSLTERERRILEKARQRMREP
ncbi:MAG: rhomboid family intramembrane serine protease [Verrucomicrobiae bacterium]|nr:rhomboid family intramembrane serine protease [Verrucomicrobiae bacterium]